MRKRGGTALVLIGLLLIPTARSLGNEGCRPRPTGRTLRLAALLASAMIHSRLAMPKEVTFRT
jgi:hypothetical protein